MTHENIKYDKNGSIVSYEHNLIPDYTGNIGDKYNLIQTTGDSENNWTYKNIEENGQVKATIKLENNTETSPDANVALLENAYTQVNNAKTTDPIEFKAENGKNYTLTYDSTNSSWLLKEKK